MASRAHANPPLLSGIYAIVQSGPRSADIAQAAARAGVRIIQYRGKERYAVDEARALCALAHQHGALFILNDRWQDVQTVGADGVHVGPDDVPLDELAQLRKSVGHAVLGVSCASAEEALKAERAGADYAGVGSVFATSSKADAGAPIGLEGLARVVRATALPVAAIGGITARDIAAVRAAGASMAAVISALSAAADVYEAARQLVRAWNDAA